MFMRGKKKPLKMLIEDDDGPTFIEWFRGMNRGHDIRFDRLLGLGQNSVLFRQLRLGLSSQPPASCPH